MQTNQLFMLHPKMQGRRKPMRRASVDECSRAVALGVTSHCLTCDDSHKRLHHEYEGILKILHSGESGVTVRSCRVSHQLLPTSASSQGHRIRAKRLLNNYSLKMFACFSVDLLHAMPVIWNRRACS